jgi:hypothetical protein
MIMKNELVKFLSISIILITISSANANTDLPIGNTYVWWLINLSTLVLLWKSKKYFYNIQNNRLIEPVILYLSWNIICILRGIFVADNYWDWKNLVSMGMVLLLPVSIYISSNRSLVQRCLMITFKYGLPCFILILPFLHGAAIGRFLVNVSIMALFFPVLSKKWKYIILILSVFVILIDLSARSNVIKFIVPLLLSLIYYCKYYLTVGMLNFSRRILLFLPIAMFLLAVFGIFNIFKMDEYLSGTYETKKIVKGEIIQESLTTDTRTPLYLEVLTSAVKYEYVIFGRTPAKGNESRMFGRFALEKLKTGSMDRYSNEVSIMNVFTWTGLVGVVLYFLVFFRATYLAVNKSNNVFLKIIGIYLSFRWTYAWVEDFSNFDLSNFLLWLLIGISLSKEFRSMNEKETISWVKGVFKYSYFTKSY